MKGKISYLPFDLKKSQNWARQLKQYFAESKVEFKDYESFFNIKASRTSCKVLLHKN